MLRALTLVLAAVVLGGCATQTRTEPPAPVVTRGVTPKAAAQPAPPAEPSVEVYPYRPPGGEPEAMAEEPAEGEGEATVVAPAESAGPGTPWSLPAERPTPPPTTPGNSSPGAAATQTVAYAPPPPAGPALAPAADALARQAEQQRQGGDYVGAAATLERALRIEPQQPYLWNRLARVRLEQGLPGQAANLAARSNALASDAALKQDNWAVIAAARRAAGDSAGAEEAERRARGG